MLVDQASSDEFRPEAYEDEVKKRIQQQLKKKIETGQEISAPPRPKSGEVIDLMEALRRSLAKAAASPRARRRPAARRTVGQAGRRRCGEEGRLEEVARRGSPDERATPRAKSRRSSASPPRRCASYVRAGLLSPGARRRADTSASPFRTSSFCGRRKGLLDARDPARRIRRALRPLAQELPDSGRA